jgi:quercetin dioxygenase-like cupin family protein
MHDHENEQVCLVTEGELTVVTEDDEVTLGPYDSVLLESNEPHRVENTGDERAVGIDVFAPGRSFDFWLDRE